jgi:hypothetical protein
MIIYRYQPINKFTLENLIHKKNWASNPIKFNDPFEFNIRTGGYINSEGKWVGINESDTLKRDSIKKTLSSMGIVSYSESDDNILLWSHYAYNHQGMCLVFEIENPEQSHLFKVKYKKNIFNLGFKNNSKNQPVLYTKSKEWSYEKEHRQIFMYNERHFDYPGELKEIIFGCQSSLSDISTVIKICNSDKITFSKMFIQQDTFNLGKSSVSQIDCDSIPESWGGKFIDGDDKVGRYHGKRIQS